MSPATVGTSTCPAVREAASTTWATPSVAEATETDAEIERRADHHDQVGALLEHGPRPQEGVGVIGRAACRARVR